MKFIQSLLLPICVVFGIGCGKADRNSELSATVDQCNSKSLRSMGWKIRLNGTQGGKSYAIQNQLKLQGIAGQKTLRINFFMDRNYGVVKSEGVKSINLFSKKKAGFPFQSIVRSLGSNKNEIAFKIQRLKANRRANFWQRIPAAKKHDLRHLSFVVGCR